MIGLHKVDKSQGEIFKLLQKLKISNLLTAYSSALSRLEPWRSWSHRVHTHQNSLKSGCRSASKSSKETVSHASWAKGIKMSLTHIRQWAGFHAYKQRKGHLLTNQLKCQRLLKSKHLLKRYASCGHQSILFNDEKIFSAQETFNGQNDRIYATSYREAGQKAPRVQRSHAVVGC